MQWKCTELEYQRTRAQNTVILLSMSYLALVFVLVLVSSFRVNFGFDKG